MTLFMRDMANVERGRAEGFSQGLATGFTQGRAEGFSQGHATGFAQGSEKTKLDTARRMLSSGMAPETIVKFIDLPVAEIEKL